MTDLRALLDDGLRPGVYRWRSRPDRRPGTRRDVAAGRLELRPARHHPGARQGRLPRRLCHRVRPAALVRPELGRAGRTRCSDRSTGEPEVVLWEGWRELLDHDHDTVDVALQIFAEDANESGQLRVLLREADDVPDLVSVATGRLASRSGGCTGVPNRAGTPSLKARWSGGRWLARPVRPRRAGRRPRNRRVRPHAVTQAGCSFGRYQVRPKRATCRPQRAVRKCSSGPASKGPPTRTACSGPTPGQRSVACRCAGRLDAMAHPGPAVGEPEDASSSVDHQRALIESRLRKTTPASTWLSTDYSRTLVSWNGAEPGHRRAVRRVRSSTIRNGTSPT